MSSPYIEFLYRAPGQTNMTKIRVQCNDEGKGKGFKLVVESVEAEVGQQYLTGNWTMEAQIP